MTRLLKHGSINERIKRIRLSQNMTLKELAQRTGLTNGYLSRIENSRTAPPISTVSKIAEALHIDISYFFGKTPEEKREIRHIAVDRESVNTKAGFLLAHNQEGRLYRYRPLFLGKSGKNMQPFIIILDFEFGPIQRSEGEEFALVLEGTMEFVYGDEKYVFSQGDSYYFDLNVPFTGRSLGNKKAKLLVIHYLYRR